MLQGLPLDGWCFRWNEQKQRVHSGLDESYCNAVNFGKWRCLPLDLNRSSSSSCQEAWNKVRLSLQESGTAYKSYSEEFRIKPAPFGGLSPNTLLCSIFFSKYYQPPLPINKQEIQYDTKITRKKKNYYAHG